MRNFTAPFVLAFAGFACGRAELDDFRPSAGVRDASVTVRGDTGAGSDVRRSDAPPGSRDTGPRRDGSVPDSGPGSCVNDCDCDPFNACINFQCRPSSRENICCTNPFCPPGTVCVLPGGGTNVCSGPDAGVRDGGTGVPVGAPCMPMSSSCGMNGFCIDEANGFPGGYCTQDCGPNGFACPGDSVCRELGGASEICLDGCMNGMDCRRGYRCVRLGLSTDRVCWPSPPASMNPNGVPVGDACMVDSDCDAGLTCLMLPGGPGDGYCTVLYCDPQTNPCPGGSLCYAFPGLFSMCLAECPNAGTQSTCRPGYYCLGPTGQSGVCIQN